MDFKRWQCMILVCKSSTTIIYPFFCRRHQKLCVRILDVLCWLVFLIMTLGLLFQWLRARCRLRWKCLQRWHQRSRWWPTRSSPVRFGSPTKLTFLLRNVSVTRSVWKDESELVRVNCDMIYQFGLLFSAKEVYAKPVVKMGRVCVLFRCPWSFLHPQLYQERRPPCRWRPSQTLCVVWALLTRASSSRSQERLWMQTR